MFTDQTEKYYAGLDLGGTFVKCGILDSRGRLLAKADAATGEGYESIIHTMASLALSLAKETGVTLSGAAKLAMDRFNLNFSKITE